MSKPEFAYVTYIRTTPERLWHALTDADFTRRYWMDCTLRSDWTVGSKMTMERGGEIKNRCTIVESDPPRRLAYDWVSVWDPAMRQEKPSRVTYEIEPQGDLVKLTVTHEDFDEGSATLPSISFGWPMVLASLKSILETGEPLPFADPAHAAAEAAHVSA
ncbi:SRPBCC family protein [Rhodopseudomonas sp. P1]|uniref:SRPBCC family protein n=1 Tax=Rhodopseudomonas sp. P1 TaxID=3434357 RepID=UPI0031FE3153